MKIENIKYNQFRFSEEFYRMAWKFAGYDKNIIPEISAIINDKVNELCGLVSVEGAMHILNNENKIR